ncbi:MAG: baseplate J/gp47 family protein, partial [bacterium]|nr:baseplate J/gp47 family protein [bacterium]
MRIRRDDVPDDRGATPVLTIPASDDLPDILEKIRRAATSRVVLDCRQHQVLKADPFVRRLLQTTAADFGKDVTFQLVGRAGRDTAAPAARRESRSQTVSGPRRKRLLPQMIREFPRSPWRRWTTAAPRGRLTLATFAVVTGMLLTGVVMFVVPRARVRLVLATEPFAADLTLWLDTSAREPQLATGTHSVRLLRVEETFEGDFPVETTVEKGARAEGSADIVNETAVPQGIKARTRLQSTSGVVVRTQRDVIVPAQGRASVAVQAEEGGSTGNLEPQRLVMPALSSASQRVLYGEAVRPLRGGTDQSVHQLAAADVERGTTILRENAERKLLEVIQSEARTASASGSQKQISFSRPELSRIAVGDAETVPSVGTEAE